jgi:hypothetical protein
MNVQLNIQDVNHVTTYVNVGMNDKSNIDYFLKLLNSLNFIENVEVTDNQSFSIENISLGDKKYILNYPIRCHFEKDEDVFIIKSEMLDIIGTGKTKVEAKNNFDQEFDYIYVRYNELDNSQLSPRIRNIKTILNFHVKSVS